MKKDYIDFDRELIHFQNKVYYFSINDIQGKSLKFFIDKALKKMIGVIFFCVSNVNNTEYLKIKFNLSNGKDLKRICFKEKMADNTYNNLIFNIVENKDKNFDI
ncbi:MAG: hypothetical protein Ta2D_13950 [Rickettsiales bacterium]|nr:MAG: hypothetical protein Ta2D_13950 [Rickettsiales bacterium]